MERPGIGDDQQPNTPLEPEPLQIAPVALQIFRRVSAEDPVPGQKFVKLAARRKAEQPAQLAAAETPLPEFIKRHRFEHTALDRAVTTKAPSEVIGEAEGDLGIGGRGVVVHFLFLSCRPCCGQGMT